MSNAIPLDDWLRHIDGEYLSTFIKAGGSAIKFTVVSDEALPGLRDAMARRCAALDYVFVSLDAARVRIHMPQDLFFEMARQVPWRFLARRVILRQAAERRYTVEGIDPGGDGNVFDAIACANDIESQFLLSEIRPLLQERVFKDPNMARDFRVAMTHLCLHEANRVDGEYGGQPLLDWLTGANTRVSPVRQFSIHTGINRTTGRHCIQSGLHWIRKAGHAGTVMLLDNRRVTVARNPKDGRRYYTRAMVVDHYELLREFVDDVDRLAGTLMLVAASTGFVDDGPGASSRGFGIYEALKTRVMDDVRDRNRTNPVAALVRLS